MLEKSTEYITSFVAWRIFNEYEHRKSIGYKYTPGYQWSLKVVLTYPLYAFFTGICAGLFGIGGGLIFCPLFLELGMHPQVATTTSNFMVVFSSTSTTVQFMIMVHIILYY